MKKLLLAASLVLAVSSVSFAKDMKDKIGAGFNSQLTATGTNALSVRYWTTRSIGIEGIMGFQVGDNKIFDIGGKFLKVVKAEQNLNIYGFGIVGIESYDIKNGPDDTAFTLGGGLGSEFFFAGLPNLGFGLEIGLGYQSRGDDDSSFGTFADWITNVGVHYYF